MSKVLVFTIPKEYNITKKLKALRSKKGYAWYETKKKPKQPYDEIIFIHNGYMFWCEKHDTKKGIGFKNLIDFRATDRKGFQGFRYVDFHEFWNAEVKFYD